MKRYTYNRSAATHREAIIKFSTISFVATIPMSIPTVILAITSVSNNSLENVRTVAILVPVIHMSSWMILLLFMCLIYYAMVQSDRPDRPTPPKRDSETVYFVQDRDNGFTRVKTSSRGVNKP